MARFLFYGNGSSSTSRLNILVLITLVLVCFCSYCSSTWVSPIIDINPSIDDIDMFDIDDGISYRYVDVPEEPILPSKDRLLNLLIQSAVIQPNYRHKDYNNKRYASQSFHAMRG